MLKKYSDASTISLTEVKDQTSLTVCPEKIMRPASNPIERLRRYETAWRRGEVPAPETLRSIWTLSRHPDAAVREAALILLSSPPLEDESRYLHATLQACLKYGRTRVREIPGPVFEQLFDLWEQAQALGVHMIDAPHFRRLLTRMVRPQLSILLSRPYSVDAFLPLVARRLVLLLEGAGPSRGKRKWRYLRLQWVRRSPPPAWGRPTLVELTPCRLKSARVRRVSESAGRWLHRCRPLLFAEAKTSLAVRPVPFRAVRWGHFGHLSRMWMDRLLDMQSRELSAVRSLAHDVSRITRRVVLSWHNAGLGAAGGWAFEDPTAFFPSPKLWKEFLSSVREQERELGALGFNSKEAAARLLNMRGERLALPAVRRALREVCGLRGLDAAWALACERARRAVAASWPEAEPVGEECGGKHAWGGPAHPGQKWMLPDILTWWKGERDSWVAGLQRMVALAMEAQKLLRRGDLESFVLPWIDKFFISSRRLRDLDYLPALVHGIEAWGLAPLILFWEDTIHPQRPSFRLALDAMRPTGPPFRGIGVFDREGSARHQALETILEFHESVRLFALRPWDDTHHPGSFHRMLDSRDFGFFSSYDSSWKDNLGFLYVGTQVFPLLSEAGYGEDLPTWVGVETRKEPFGRFFRRSVRWRTLGTKAFPCGDPLSVRYARWANLG